MIFFKYFFYLYVVFYAIELIPLLLIKTAKNSNMTKFLLILLAQSLLPGITELVSMATYNVCMIVLGAFGAQIVMFNVIFV